MRVLLIIIAVSALAAVAAAFDIARITAEDYVETPRQAALLCWHEFQSGRRATTADCPEL
jgi:hypothetical protein